MLLNNANHSKNLLKRFLFSVFILLIYRFGSYITIPGIDVYALQKLWFDNHSNSSFFDILNGFSGGALGRMTLFALSVMPYIIASIVFQLLSVAFPTLSNLKQEGAVARRKVNFYIRFITMLICFVQAVFLVVSLQNMKLFNFSIEISSSYLLQLLAILTLVGGSMFLVWLGEQITIYGIGNGLSLIIVVGIIAEIPYSISSLFSLGRDGDVSIIVMLFILIFILLLLCLIIFIEQSYRKVLIQYPRGNYINNLHSIDNHSYIPLKINISGAIPPIFANAVLLFCISIIDFLSNALSSVSMLVYFTPGKLLYIVLYIIFIVFFCFFYVDFALNTNDISQNLKKGNGLIIGYRPGQDTSLYLKCVILRVTVLGAMYLSFICIIPELFRVKYDLPFSISGTSLLIVINVIIDIFFQVQSYFFTQYYSKLNDKFKRL